MPSRRIQCLVLKHHVTRYIGEERDGCNDDELNGRGKI